MLKKKKKSDSDSAETEVLVGYFWCHMCLKPGSHSLLCLIFYFTFDLQW